MSTLSADRPRSAPPLPAAVQWLLGRICTSNPFYVISAGLFLAGLNASFEAPAGEIDTWALLTGLSGYTLLLAATAFLLVRFAGAWDDLRTVLLLVVLFFLASSVTFDEVLVLAPGRGTACFLIGLAFAIAVSEGLLRGIRLRLPGWFRLSYHLMLALFFLYPLVLRSLMENRIGVAEAGPPNRGLQWGLFAFSSVAALAFLSLLPAIHRGAAYVRGNGSPWRWPLYPWTLFGMLALAVPARAVLLCVSMHLLNNGDRGHSIFGLYFLVPFGFAVAALLLEIGLVAAHAGVQRIALAIPLVLVVLSMLGHRGDSVYQGFLEMFTTRFGATPLFLTMVAMVAFYGYAAARRVPTASACTTVALLALAFVGRETLGLRDMTGPWAVPLFLAAGVQLAFGMARRHASQCTFGGVLLSAAVAVALPAPLAMLRGAALFHLAVLTVLIVGAVFKDDAGRFLRSAGAGLVFIACLVVSLGGLTIPFWQLPAWVIVYAPLAATALLLFGYLLHHHRASYLFAGLSFAVWLLTGGCRAYLALRQLVPGLDAMAISMAVFVVAVLISLYKCGVLGRLHYSLVRQAPPSS